MADNDGGVKTWEMTTLTQTWVRRLQTEVALPHDAFIVVGGPAELVGRRLPLDKTAKLIPIRRGAMSEARSPGDPLELPSDYVSEDHARLESTINGWHLKHVDERSRTYVGTVRALDHRLVYGDEVRIGNFVLLFVPAALEQVPVSVLDTETGLLTSRVFVAEIAKLGDRRAPPGDADFGLVLIRVEGLRAATLGLDATPKPGEKSGSPLSLRTLGRALLQAVPGGVPLARLESNLFAAAFASVDRQSITDLANQLSRVLLEVGLNQGLRLPTLIVAPRLGRTLSGPQVLTGAISALESIMEGQKGTVVEADLEATGSLLMDEALIAHMLHTGSGKFLLASIQDEDYLRIQLGNQRLASLRWNLRKAVRSVGATEKAAGVLDDRVFVLHATQPTKCEERLRESFREFTPHPLQTGIFELSGEQRDAAQLRRQLILAADAGGQTFAQGHRESVDKLPTPIAAPYGLIWVVSSEHARVKTVLDAFESTIRFVSLAMLAGTTTADAPIPEAVTAVQRRLRDRLPLGEWVGLLRDLVPCMSKIDHPVIDVLERVVGSKRQFTQLAERELLPFRNYFAHSPTGMSEHLSGERAKMLLISLNQIIQDLSPLRELELLSVLSTELKKYTTNVKVRILTDARENFEVRNVVSRGTRTDLFVGSCYLATSDYASVLDLDPLVKFELCPMCEQEEIFMAQGLPRPGRTIEMVAVTTGHKWRWKPDEEDFPPEFLDLLEAG